MRSIPPRTTQSGLTLIELLISITIGLVVVGAVTYMYVGSKGTYRGNEALARIQEAGRFALDSMARDIRRAGALGCGTLDSVAGQAPVQVNMIAAGLAVDGNGQPIALTGFEPAGAAYQPQPLSSPVGFTLPTTFPTYQGGDVLQLQIASGVPVRVTAEDTTAGTITIAANTIPGGSGANFKNNNYAVLANCSAASVFQVSGLTGASTVISYASPVVALTGAGQFSLAADTYPTLQHYDQVTYYIGQVPNSVSSTYPNGLPALYRYSLSSNQPPEELVENVEDMDVVYGVDNTPNDGNVAPDVFWKAAAVTAANAWPTVVSVRVSIVAVGDQLGVAPGAQTLLFHGTDTSPLVPVAQVAPDTRLRQVFNVTVALRDRLQ